MSIEVRCPDCDGTWQIDKPRGGEMLCPSCMTRIPLVGTTPGNAQAATTPAVGPATPEPPTDPAPSVLPAPRPAARHEAEPPDAQVVCPRCHLHFRPRQRTAGPAENRQTILVVDDLAYFRKLAEDALEPTFEIRTAATSAEARDILAAGGIDLLVLDLTLDGGNAGRDLLAELTPKPCPILIFTAKDESEMYGESWEELQRLGADDLVIKGMKVAESLVRKASALLGVPVDEPERIG